MDLNEIRTHDLKVTSPTLATARPLTPTELRTEVTLTTDPPVRNMTITAPSLAQLFDR